MNKTITVFGSSNPVEGEEEYITAYSLGYKLAENGFTVCTGGYLGIMEAVSKGAVEAGGNAIGVTVKSWGRSGNRFLTKEIACDELFDRLNKLIELGDAFVVLRGGTGTLLELAAVWELSNKNMMDKRPIICHSQLWMDVVAAMNKQMKHEGRSTNIIKTMENIDEIVSFLISELK